MNIYPGVFLVAESNPYRESIADFIAALTSQYPDLFFSDVPTLSFDDLIGYIPSNEIEAKYLAQGIKIKHSYIISFIDLSANNNNEFFNFLTKVKNDHSFAAHESTDYRFINIFMRDLSRTSAAATNDWLFYEKFEKFCKENTGINSHLSLRYIHNIVIDKFNEQRPVPLDNIENIFKQLGRQLEIILTPSGSNEVSLANCLARTARVTDSSIRYNTLGYCSAGFNQKRVGECIALKRKSDFLLELTCDRGNDINVELEILKAQRSFFNNHYLDLEEEVFNEIYESFVTGTAPLVSDFEKKIKQKSKTKTELNLPTIQFFNLIDEKGKEEFKTVYEDKDGEVNNLSENKINELNSKVAAYLNENFDQFGTSKSLKAAEFTLLSLITEKPLNAKKKIQQVLEDADEVIPSVKAMLKRVQKKRVPTLKIQNKDKIRSSYQESVHSCNEKIGELTKRKERTEQELTFAWLTKFAKVIVLLPLFTLLVGVGFYYLQEHKLYWDWQTIWKVLVCAIPTILAIARGIYVLYALKKKLREIKNEIAVLEERRAQIIKQYIETYDDYYRNLSERLGRAAIVSMLLNNIRFIKDKLELVQSFKTALTNLQKGFLNQYNDFVLDDSHFNYSFINKAEIEYYCTKNNLTFFNDINVSDYFQLFVDNGTYFKPLKFKNYTIDSNEEEVIAQNENEFSENYLYKKIEAFETKIFLRGNEEINEIVHGDVKQGMLGDCYFLAALSAVAYKNRSYIKDMIIDDAAFPSVFFYDGDINKQEVKVNKKFWVNDKDQPVYAKFGSSQVLENQVEIWPMLIEKGWAKINGADYTNITGDNRTGDIRNLDYSLALTGHKAFREFIDLSYKANLIDVLNRLETHNDSKPVVLYSSNETEAADILNNHAFALLEFKNNTLELYDPHGKIVSINSNDLLENFDTILYFDFSYQEDTHLTDLFSEYFVRHADNNLIKEFDSKIENDLTRNVFDKSMEEAMTSAVFNVSLNDEKIEEAVQQIIKNASPFVNLYGVHDQSYHVYYLGDNKSIKSVIDEQLPKNGIRTNSVTILESNEKIIGLLNLRNDLKKEEISKNR
jgi:hypothetical protein